MPAELKTEPRTDTADAAALTVLSALDCIDCPVCGSARPAEHPVSDDASDDERLCVDCGAAVFVDPMVPVRATAA
jgi:hypothetical protein